MGYGYNGREHCIGSARHGWDGYTPAYLVLFLRFLLFFFFYAFGLGWDAWMLGCLQALELGMVVVCFAALA
jgi:hypothetical protein